MHMVSLDMLKLATQPMELIGFAMEQPAPTLKPAEPPVIRPRQDCSSFLAEVPSRHRTNTLDTVLQKNHVDKNICNADDVFPALLLEEQISEHQISSVRLAGSQADRKRMVRMVSPEIDLLHRAIIWLDKLRGHVVHSTIPRSELTGRKRVADASPDAFLKPIDENASQPNE